MFVSWVCVWVCMCVCIYVYITGLALMVPLAIFIPLYICVVLGGIFSGMFGYKLCNKEARNDAEEGSAPSPSFLGTFFGVGNQGGTSTDALRRFLHHTASHRTTPHHTIHYYSVMSVRALMFCTTVHECFKLC